MASYKTEQEEFWAGDFGTEYTERNVGEVWIANNTVMFSKIIARTQRVSSIIEFGSNRGINLLALRNILPAAELSAVEINQQAVEKLRNIPDIKIYPGSILDYNTDYQRDLVLCKGVLIHLNPDILHEVYRVFYNSSNRYICLVEYYNPTPIEVSYRGYDERMFKRDFAGEMLDLYPDLHLVDYGFVYHRDANFSLDDLTWFLLEKGTK